jgi:hypothetical protein
MPDLHFTIESAEPVPCSVSPLLSLRMRIQNSVSQQRIQSILLQAHVLIEANRRLYDESEQSRLVDLFGEPTRSSQSPRTMLWTHVSVNVRSFVGCTSADLHVPCTFDFNIAATKYFDGLTDGDIPLCLLFSGTVFYQADDRGLHIARIPWKKEARFRLPVSVWKRLMDQYYPNSAWLNLRRDVFEKLHQYKRQRGIATWEQAVEQLLQ